MTHRTSSSSLSAWASKLCHTNIAHEWMAGGRAGADITCSELCGDIALTGCSSGIVSVWKAGTGAGLGSSPVSVCGGHSASVSCATVDTCGSTVVSGSVDGSLKVSDMHAQATLRSMRSTGGRITCVHAHPFGDYFASGSEDGRVRVWDCRWRNSIATYSGHRGQVTVLKHSPDGQWVVSADDTGSVKMWSLTAGRMLKELPGDRNVISSIAFHPHHLLLAIASNTAGSQLEVWDLDCWRDLGSVRVPGTGVRGICFSDDGSALLAASSGCIRAYSCDDTGPIACLAAADGPFKHVQHISHTKENITLALSIQGNRITLHSSSGEDRAPVHATDDEVAHQDVQEQAKMEKESRPLMCKTEEDKAPSKASPLDEVMADHESTMTSLAARLNQLRILGSLWDMNVGCVIDALLRIEDASVTCDFLCASEGALVNEYISLDMLCGLLQILVKVLSSETPHHVVIALGVLREALTLHEQALTQPLSNPTHAQHAKSSLELITSKHFEQLLARLRSSDNNADIVNRVDDVIARISMLKQCNNQS